MLSASVHLPAAPFPESSRFEVESFREGPRLYTEHIKSWHSLVKEGKFGTGAARRLPAPPETTAMTGVSLNQHSSNAVVSQSYYPPKFSYPAHPSGRGAEVGPPQRNVKSYTHNNASTGDESQFWSGIREREDRYAPKDNASSDSAIASYLQIPSSINDSRGSLAEFAAEVGHVLFRLQAHLTFSR